MINAVVFVTNDSNRYRFTSVSFVSDQKIMKVTKSDVTHEFVVYMQIPVPCMCVGGFFYSPVSLFSIRVGDSDGRKSGGWDARQHICEKDR